MPDDRPRLRPPTLADFWMFERQSVDPEAAGTFNWSGFRDSAALKRRLGESGLIGPDGGCLIVEADEEAAGTVVWNKATYGTPSWWCWNIGISLLPEFRGKGIGTAAQQELATYLFQTTPTERVEAYTDVDNTAEQRSLERIGFTKEGLIRSAQFRYGRWRTLVLYSLLRDECLTPQTHG